MLVHGQIEERSYYFFDPDANGYHQLKYVVMKKERDKDGREIRVPKYQDAEGGGIITGTRSVIFTHEHTLINFASFRRSDKEPVERKVISAGSFVFDVVSVTLPKRVREEPFEIVVEPGTFWGLALVGLETILQKEKRVRETPPIESPKYTLFQPTGG